MAHAAAYYWYNKTPELTAVLFFTTVPFGMDATGMSAGATRRRNCGINCIPLSLKDLPAAIQACRPRWFRKAITNTSDFQGLKMRIPGLAVKPSPNLVLSSKTFRRRHLFALETGRIDAEWGPYHDIQKFHQVAKHYYTGWYGPGATPELLINKAAWTDSRLTFAPRITACAAETDRRWLVGNSGARHRS